VRVLEVQEWPVGFPEFPPVEKAAVAAAVSAAAGVEQFRAVSED